MLCRRFDYNCCALAFIFFRFSNSLVFRENLVHPVKPTVFERNQKINHEQLKWRDPLFIFLFSYYYYFFSV